MTKTCIICPLGCQVSIAQGDIQGHGCKRGRDWAMQEFQNPARMLTTTIAIEDGAVELLPVRTLMPVAKTKLGECMAHANTLKVKAPVKAGQVVCTNLADTGIDLVATRSIASN